MAKRAAQGSGSIRKKTIIGKGKTYTYWEGRYTAGIDPGTGKQIQKSLTGKTQKEVREKLQQISVSINEGTYLEPSKLTIALWSDIWLTDYVENSVKPHTYHSYQTQMKVHIKPNLGSIKLTGLTAPQIQHFYNDLQKVRSLSAKTVRNIHGILHKCLSQAVKLGFIRYNPSDNVELPKVTHKEINPLDNEAIKTFLNAIQGHRYETLFVVDLFTGMRQSEIIGLTWDCIDFASGTIFVYRQLQREKIKGGTYQFVSLKNNKSRTIKAAPTLMSLLKEQKRTQSRWKLHAGAAWKNEDDLVFTGELGHHLAHHTVYKDAKKVYKEIGLPSTRFHDLRHSYATAALDAGDSMKNVQTNLGHYSSAFTMDTYAHVTVKMQQESADKMEAFINGVKAV